MSRYITGLSAGSILILSLIACPQRGLCLPTCGSTISSPCVITSPGHYALTGNVAGAASTDAIQVNTTSGTADAQIAMAGWNITGGTTSGQGIDTGAGSSYDTNVTVLNGHVKTSGSYGINLGDVSDIENVTLYNNGNYGIWGDPVGLFFQDIAYNNSGTGIESGSDSVIRENVSGDNTGDGIYTASTCAVVENDSGANTGDGLNMSATSTGYARNVTGGDTGSGCNSGTSMGENLCN